jgi:hypothetical protein
MHRLETDRVIIHYSLRDIQEEVFKRTSMLARGENAIRYNELVLSRGEEFMFSPYLVNIASELFDYISPFCKEENTGFHLSDSVNPVCANENMAVVTNSDDVEYQFSKLRWFNDRALVMLDNSIFEALVNGIIWEWLSIFGESELSAKYKFLYDRAITNLRNRINTQKGPVRRKYTLF